MCIDTLSIVFATGEPTIYVLLKKRGTGMQDFLQQLVSISGFFQELKPSSRIALYHPGSFERLTSN
jgi:hypothetical protein